MENNKIKISKESKEYFLVFLSAMMGAIIGLIFDTYMKISENWMDLQAAYWTFIVIFVVLCVLVVIVIAKAEI